MRATMPAFPPRTRIHLPLVRAALVAALAMLSGCSLAPGFDRPATPGSDTWKGESAKTAAAASWPSSDWWRNFKAPELDRLIDQAQHNNQDLAAAAARVLEANAKARVAGAPLLPSLGAGAGVSRSWRGSSAGSSTSSSGSSSSGRSSHEAILSADLNASYQVDLFGANRAALESAEASAAFSRFDKETVALTVVSGVATTYFQTLEFRNRIAVARRNLANAEEVLRVVEARVRNGAASALDLAQQRATVATERAAIPPLEIQAQQAENALAILLGEPPVALDVAGTGIMAIVPPSPSPGLPSQLLARRPDIQAAEANLIAANADIGAARAAFYPAITLTGTQGYESAALGDLLRSSNAVTTLASSLVQPIFEGGKLEGNLDLAKARYRELAATYRTAVLNAFADVENALVATRQAAAQEQLQRQVVTEARNAYRLAETQYRSGAVDLVTVLDAQRTLFQAEDQLVQVRFTRLQAAVSMYKALGGGWRRPAAAVAAPAGRTQ